MRLSPDNKDFRLSPAVRPSRYEATLRIDPEKKAFHGEETIEVVLSESAAEIVLHAVELPIAKASCRAGGTERTATSVAAEEASGTVVLRFAEPIPAGAATLAIHWSGRFNSGLRGLYQAAGVAVTQFEAAEARRVFPCFDEPAFKAVWSITLEAPRGAALLSNGAPVSESEAGPLRRVRFQETPLLSSYLVALACGDLASTPAVEVRGIPVRSWSVPQKLRLASFGQTVALEVLPRLEDYFGLPYAFGKLDQVAVPDFEAGAMENAGLITYREVLLLLDPETASLAQKKRLAEVVTHELAHQWFGNWVTMVWWDDLWLNEAFATWMAFKIVDGWKPEWRLWLEFDASKAAALQLDALRATHPIRAEVRNAAEAGESFDAITYEKGGAVLRMIESYLGEAPFRDGIRAYMRKHAKANAVADDLWSALAESSRQPVLELANAWIRQAGFPLVHVSRAGGRRVTLTQHRFYSDPKAVEPAGAAQRWPVPMIFRYRDAAGVQEHRVLFTEATAEVELPATGELAWLCANAGATGFFRVSYDRPGLQQLAQHLGDLAPAERVALLSDQWALVRTGKTEIAAFLDLCSAFGAEEDDAVLDELGSRLAQVGQRLVADRDRTRFQDFVSELLGAQLRVVGWDPKPGEDDAARLRRASLVRTLGLTARSQPVITEAVARLERYLAGQGNALEPNLYDAAVTMAARTGDLKRFDQFLERFRAETDPAFRRRFLFSLAAFEAAEPCLRAQELAFTDTVPLQEVSSFVGGLLANPVAREPFWATLRARWDAVASRLANAPMLLRRVVEAMGLLVERRQLEEVEAFLATHPMDAATQAIAQTLERLRLDVALRERSQEPISRWLDQRAKR